MYNRTELREMMQDSDMPWYSGQHFVVLSVFLGGWQLGQISGIPFAAVSIG